jgi:FAD/FMN-containing dehydrogenase
MGLSAEGTTAVDIARSLAPRLQGEVVSPVDPDYDASRAIFNAMIDKHPAAIARCISVRDAQACVEFARAERLPLSIRGGGHNVAGNALCDGGIAIDFSRLRDVVVDPEARVAQAQPGATWSDYDRATQQFRLASPGGIVSTTGVAGLTLGGGIGTLRGLHGLACDNLIGAEMVTAEGETVRASEDGDAELLWGLRGGGGNFGVVTALDFRLHEVDAVAAGTLVFPFERVHELLLAYREFMTSAPPELNCDIGFKRMADGRLRVVFLPTFFGSEVSGRRVLSPLTSLGDHDDLFRAMSYREAQSIHDVNFPPGQRHYWKSNFLHDLSDAAINVIAEMFPLCPSPITAVAVEHLHGAVVDDEGMAAFAHRSAPYNLLIESRWLKPSADEENIAWTREFWERMQAFSTGGVYVNYLGVEDPDRVRAAYGDVAYARLTALKAKYDPENVFHLNQNIPPAA